MEEVSLFIDESGDPGWQSEYYLVSVVIHVQSDEYANHLAAYSDALTANALDDIPFHFGPLLTGHGDYENLTLHTRKKLLFRFDELVRKLPFTYQILAYRKAMFSDIDRLYDQASEDLRWLFIGHLEFFQRFDRVKVYYDGGQPQLSSAIYKAVRNALSKEAVVYRNASPRQYRFAQVADYLCGIELIALRYENKRQTRTDELFFGGSTSFKKNWLRKIRRKMMG